MHVTLLVGFMVVLLHVYEMGAGCRDYFGKSLFMVGEMGGNDYGIPLRARRSLEEARSYVPKVIETISMVIEVGFLKYGTWY